MRLLIRSNTTQRLVLLHLMLAVSMTAYGSKLSCYHRDELIIFSDDITNFVRLSGAIEKILKERVVVNIDFSDCV